MSYLIKSPVKKNVKFAHVYVSTTTTFAVAGNTTVTNSPSFGAIVGSSGIGITLSNGNLVLSNKEYVIYNAPNVKLNTTVTSSIKQYCYNTLYLNGTEIPDQVYAGRKENSLTNGGTYPTGYCSFIAATGDILSSVTVTTSKHASSVNMQYMNESDTGGSPHSLFIWEIDL